MCSCCYNTNKDRHGTGLIKAQKSSCLCLGGGRFPQKTLLTKKKKTKKIKKKKKKKLWKKGRKEGRSKEKGRKSR